MRRISREIRMDMNIGRRFLYGHRRGPWGEGFSDLGGGGEGEAGRVLMSIDIRHAVE